MNLGFIGTGKIASSVITGICKSQIKFKKISYTELCSLDNGLIKRNSS